MATSRFSSVCGFEREVEKVMESYISMFPRKQVNVLGSKSFMFINVKEQILTLLMMLFDADADAH